MNRVCFLSFLFVASVSAAPVPKTDPELQRIARVFGTLHDRDGCKLGLDEKDVLTVTLEKARPPKEAKKGEKETGLKLPVPTKVSFGRPVKGEFTATAQFQLKTDLTQRPDDLGVSVEVAVEYSSGALASIGCTLSTGPALDPVDNSRRRIVAGFHSFTHDPESKEFKGKSVESGTPPPGDVPMHLRVRCADKKVFLEVSGNGKKWESYDKLTLKEAGEATVKLTVTNSHGTETVFVIDRFELK